MQLSTRILEQLRELLGWDGVLVDPDRLLVYESDGLTQYRFPPAAVLLPRTTEELQGAVRLLHQAAIPMIPRGAGTGLSGGCLAVTGGVVVGTARLNRILELDPIARLARVQPGVVNADLSREALRHGLLFAPDPSSQSACTLGGNVAENSGGPHCLKYGVTNRYVTGLRVVLPSGEMVELEGERGLDLVGLFVGSEGCMGFAAEIEVALIPAPEGVRTLLGIFSTVEGAGEAVTAIIAQGLLPAALEMIDSETIRAVESSVFAAGYPQDAGAALVVEFDGVEGGMEAELERAADACREAGAREVRLARGESERSSLWAGRKKAFGAMGRLAPDLLVQDATVPRTKLPEVLRGIAEIGRRHRLLVANVFHAGDGNLHPNLLFDRRDAEELSRVETASHEIMELCIEAGGTITGEHGVGLDKRKYMSRIYTPQVLEAMRVVQEVFDPKGLMNPGKVLPDRVPPPVVEGERSQLPLVRPRRGGEVLPRLEALLGRSAVLMEGEVPKVAPQSEEEVSALLRLAGEEGWSLLPVGSGLEIDPSLLGYPSPSQRGSGSSALRRPEPPSLLLSTRHLRTPMEHEPADLTLRLGAGHTLSEAQVVVGLDGQRIALDPPGGGGATMGGVVSTGRSGALRPLYGRPKDQLLGLTLVAASGDILRLGGRVVKNVAGFDLVRLAAGSRGALGIITEVTLRLYPIPAVDLTLLWRAESLEQGWSLGRRLALLPLPLAGAELFWGEWGGRGELRGGPDAGGEREGWVLLRLQGSAPAVDRMRSALVTEAGCPPEWDVEGAESEALARRLAEADQLRPGATYGSAASVAALGPVLPELGRLELLRLRIGLLQGGWSLTFAGEPREDWLSSMRREVREGVGPLPLGPRFSSERGGGAYLLERGIAKALDPRGTMAGGWRMGEAGA